MGDPSWVVLSSQLLFSRLTFSLILSVQGISLPFVRSILPGLVNLFFNDPVVDIVHPVVVGGVTLVPLWVILALGRIMLMIGVSLTFVFVITMSLVAVPGLLVILLTIVAFAPGVVVTIVTLFPAVARGLSWCMAVAFLRSVAVESMIHRRPLDTHGMVVPRRRPITRHPDMSGVRGAIVAFYPDIFIIWAISSPFQLNHGKSEGDIYLSSGHSALCKEDETCCHAYG
jgi:hypothetical protein